MSAVTFRSTAPVSTSGTSDCAGCSSVTRIHLHQPETRCDPFYQRAISFQFPQLVQHFFRLISSRAASSADVAFPIAFSASKQSPLKFPPGKNHFSTQTNQPLFRRSYSCFSNSIGVGPDGRFGAASCRRTGGMLRPLPTCFAHFVSCRSASRFKLPFGHLALNPL